MSIDQLPKVMSVDDRLSLELMDDRHEVPMLKALQANRDHLDGTFSGTVPEVFEPKHARSYLKNHQEIAQKGTSAPYVIIQDGDLIGEATLHSKKGTNAVTSTWVNKAYWGQGVATRARTRLFTFGFDEWGLDSLSSHIASNNERSQRLAAASGFVMLGRSPIVHWIKDDQPTDKWELTRAEWEARRAK